MRRTVLGNGDLCLDNLSGGHDQTPEKSSCPSSVTSPANNITAKLANQFIRTGPGCQTAIPSVTNLIKIPAWELVGPGISNILKKSLGKHLCSKYEEHHSEIQINQNPKMSTSNIVREKASVK